VQLEIYSEARFGSRLCKNAETRDNDKMNILRNRIRLRKKVPSVFSIARLEKNYSRRFSVFCVFTQPRSLAAAAAESCGVRLSPPPESCRDCRRPARRGLAHVGAACDRHRAAAALLAMARDRRRPINFLLLAPPIAPILARNWRDRCKCTAVLRTDRSWRAGILSL
jgi:hypothetical protein